MTEGALRSVPFIIGGAEAEPGKLKAGQMCAVTYPDNGDAAIRVECR